jgi:hypothetical protein
MFRYKRSGKPYRTTSIQHLRRWALLSQLQPPEPVYALREIVVRVALLLRPSVRQARESVDTNIVKRKHLIIPVTMCCLLLGFLVLELGTSLSNLLSSECSILGMGQPRLWAFGETPCNI